MLHFINLLLYIIAAVAIGAAAYRDYHGDYRRAMNNLWLAVNAIMIASMF